ncbi:MAG: type II toxin-antitoxin system RelE/ParE family toxin [Sporomusaceae bacterium]|jgi:plasmid stabilization system protein ParE|nr:type II toxin-antitoxin system RelE/ParE family toxin [Sporomusaceae bacterium]
MLKYKLVILTPAQRELEEVADIHFQLAGSDSAIKITDKILDAIEKLKAFPLLGVLSKDKELQQKGFRILIVGKYLCVYRVIEKTVFIYHIVYGATNYPKLFKSLVQLTEKSNHLPEN